MARRHASCNCHGKFALQSGHIPGIRTPDFFLLPNSILILHKQIQCVPTSTVKVLQTLRKHYNSNLQGATALKR
jgi:hypothetical protein